MNSITLGEMSSINYQNEALNSLDCSIRNSQSGEKDKLNYDQWFTHIYPRAHTKFTCSFELFRFHWVVTLTQAHDSVQIEIYQGPQSAENGN